uniref:chorismate mutase n=1 Tax=Brassica campestris TaxID=3711 RepID=M4EWA6_BRACM
MLPPLQYPKVLHCAADSININNKIWNMYFRDLVPRLVKKGDDGNYGSTAVCDAICLQDALMDMLTFLTVEEAIKKRVEIKTRAYGQEVKVGMEEKEEEESQVYKISPVLVGHFYNVQKISFTEIRPEKHGKTSWPELMGTKGDYAASVIERENPEVTAAVIVVQTPVPFEYNISHQVQPGLGLG